jgi:endonuclease/exonuclease/phosphatase family metal-dependent hydrolase
MRKFTLLLLAAALVSLCALPGAATAKKKAATVKVMSRNLYLGADLTPGVKSQNFQELVDAAGTILNDVDKNKFAVRAKGLAKEIRSKNPDLVGLQEASLWRTQPCTKSPLPPSATTVRYDYIDLLLKQLNKGKKRYAVAVSKDEFDFEIYANTDGNRDTAAQGCSFGAETNARLTMRDAILYRTTGKRVKLSNPLSGTYDTLYQARPAGFPVNVTRGWTTVDAKVKGAPKFHFVNTHFEAFDNQPTGNHTNKGTDVNNGQIREAQAKELVASGGPATSTLPVILVGDLNSDKRSEQKPGDALAYNVMLAAGFVERSTHKPYGCCLEPSVITASSTAKVKQMDHQVDHVMTSSPKKIKLKKSAVTGRKPSHGFWDSDHAGLYSALSFKK